MSGALLLRRKKDKLQTDKNLLGELQYLTLQSISDKINDSEQKSEICSKSKSLIAAMTQRIQELRQQKVTLERSIQKIVGMAGADWRGSKYFHLICKLKVTKYDTENAIHDGLMLIDELGRTIAVLNDVEYQTSPAAICLSEQSNYVELSGLVISVRV